MLSAHRYLVNSIALAITPAAFSAAARKALSSRWAYFAPVASRLSPNSLPTLGRPTAFLAPCEAHVCVGSLGRDKVVSGLPRQRRQRGRALQAADLVERQVRRWHVRQEETGRFRQRPARTHDQHADTFLTDFFGGDVAERDREFVVERLR